MPALIALFILLQLSNRRGVCSEVLTKQRVWLRAAEHRRMRMGSSFSAVGVLLEMWASFHHGVSWATEAKSPGFVFD